MPSPSHDGLIAGCHDQSRAAAFLEDLQARVYGSLGLSAEDCQRREWMGQQAVVPARLQQMALRLTPAEFDRYRESLLEGLARDESAPRPTRFERPHQYSILRELQQAIESAASRLSLDLPVKPVLGTLPTRLLEPLMLPVPGTGDVVLVVDGSLLTYAHQLAKSVAQSLPLGIAVADGAGPALPPGWHSGIDPTGAGRTRFMELMQACLEGNPGTVPSYLPDPRWETVAADLCDGMELFLVGREYARLIQRDHLEARPERRSAHGQPFDVLAWTGEQELKADWIGLALMLAAATDRGAPLSWAFWSADLLLASFAVYDRAAWLISTPPGGTPPGRLPATHEERRRLLRDLMRQWPDGDGAVAFAENLEPVVDVLEAHVTSVLAKQHLGPAHIH